MAFDLSIVIQVLVLAVAFVLFIWWVGGYEREKITFSSMQAPFDLAPLDGLSADLEFRSMSADDYSTYAGLILNEETMATSHLSVETIVGYLDALRDAETYRQFSNNSLLGVERSSGRIVGSATMWPSDEASDGLQIGLAMDESFRGRGYGRQLMAAMILTMQHTFLVPVSAVTERSNVPAQRLMESLGYEIAGQRSSESATTGEMVEWVVYDCGVHTHPPVLR